MQSHVESDVHEDVKLQNKLRHVLDVLIDEHEIVKMPSRSHESIVAYVEARESRIFKSTLVCQLNGNPTLFKDQLTRIKVGILYMKPSKLLSTANLDTMLNLGCDCGVCMNTHEARIVKKKRRGMPIKVRFVGRVYKMRRKFGNRWVEYKDPIDLMDCSSNMEILLCWYQKGTNDKWTYYLTDHLID